MRIYSPSGGTGGTAQGWWSQASDTQEPRPTKTEIRLKGGPACQSYSYCACAARRCRRTLHTPESRMPQEDVVNLQEGSVQEGSVTTQESIVAAKEGIVSAS